MIIDPNCQVCRHSQRLQIDLAVKTLGQRATAKRFGISRQAIQRHLDKGHSDYHEVKLAPGTKVEPVVIPTKELLDNPEPFTDPTLAHDGIVEAPEEEDPGVVAPREAAEPRQRRGRKVRKMPPKRPVVDRRTVSQAELVLAAMSDYTSRKRYIGKLLRTGTFNGMPTLERLKGCWPDLTMLGLAELVAQAAMEADFLRGTRQARRLVVLAKADRIYRDAMDKKDWKVALRALEFTTRVDGISAEPDLVASLASSQAWTITARVLQAKFPEAFEAIHSELVAEEARRRQVSAPTLVESDHATE